MYINSEISNKINELTGDELVDVRSIAGGCIADSKIVTTQSGKQFFVKNLFGADDMFRKEANGLRELSKAASIRVPEVIHADNAFLVLECIEQGGKPHNFFTVFGQSFAQMHQYTSNSFGFFEDNYIGASPQYNICSGDAAQHWPAFYYEKRLLPQLKMAEANGVATQELRQGIHRLEARIETILSGSTEPPALLHGDLWGGNYLCDALGKPVLIDPAVYYGHREADLAMTKMFGGFAPDFYSAYQYTYPLADGWEYRRNMYILYHCLNHLNLFGGSYYGQCISIMRSYL